MTSETFQAPPWPRGVLWGSGILAFVVGCVALTPAPWFIRLVALTIALLVVGWTLFVLLPPPSLALDDQGFTLHRRLAGPRRVAWADVESFEIGQTPGMPVPLRILAFLAALLLAPVGAISSDPTDISEAAIGWRMRRLDRASQRRMDGWIVGRFSLPQDELLARLNARLSASR